MSQTSTRTGDRAYIRHHGALRLQGEEENLGELLLRHEPRPHQKDAVVPRSFPGIII